jgi:hypothetical protein
METMWFSKHPGGVPVNEEENALLLGDGTPNWVHLPTDLGGGTVKVIRSFIAPCPVRKVDCRHLELEGGICVAESNQFYWYRKGKI